LRHSIFPAKQIDKFWRAALRSEYDTEAISLHDGHALVTESIVKMGLVAWTEFVNAQLLDRTLGEVADADAKPAWRKKKLLHTESFGERFLLRF
jgi:hypothetical protein